MKTHSRKTLEAKLDSLLDTLFNFVGILIIIIALFQITASETARKILPEESDELDELRAELNLAQGDRIEPDPTMLETLQAQLTNQLILSTISDLIQSPTNLTILESRLNQLSHLNPKHAELTDELRTTNKELREKQLTTSHNNRLQVPMPRPPPDGAMEIRFICQNGKIASDEHSDSLIGEFNKKMLEILERRETKIVTSKLLDSGRFTVDELLIECASVWFKDKPFKNDYFKLDFTSSPGWAVPKILKNGLGETDSEILLLNSNFQRKLRKVRYLDCYINFIVYDDSHAVYSEARQIVDKLGLSAGWESFGENRIYGTPYTPSAKKDAGEIRGSID